MQPLIAPEEHSARFLQAGCRYINTTSSSSSAPSFPFSPSFSPSFPSSSSSSSVEGRDVHGTNAYSLTGGGGGEVRRSWWVYEREADVGRVIRWLDAR